MAATTARRGLAAPYVALRLALPLVLRVALCVALCVALLAVVAGCGEEDSGDLAGYEWPAAAAGPACQLIEYDTVAAHLGTRFDTAGGGRKDKTVSCALTQAGRDYPDLVLALTETSADEIIFRALVVPSGATALKGLGKIAYRLKIAATGKRGPGVEIGWLSDSERIMVVRYTFAPAPPEADVDALPGKLLALAKQIEQGPAPLS